MKTRLSKGIFISGLTKKRRNKLTLTGATIIVIFTILAILAPWIAPHPPDRINLTDRLLSPNRIYPLGTDHLGRCMFSRILCGTRYTLGLPSMVLLITLSISIVLGSISGYYGGLVDGVIMRIVDLLLAFPAIILAIAIVGLLGPGLFNLLLAMSIIWWVELTRIVRGLVVSIKEREFIDAVRVLGAGDSRIMFRHIFPNIIAPIIVLLTLDMGKIILSISGLSFIGLGANPPTPEWGAILSEGCLYMETSPHLMIFPGTAIMLAVMGFILLGDGLRDHLDLQADVRPGAFI